MTQKPRVGFHGFSDLSQEILAKMRSSSHEVTSTNRPTMQVQQTSCAFSPNPKTGKSHAGQNAD